MCNRCTQQQSRPKFEWSAEGSHGNSLLPILMTSPHTTACSLCSAERKQPKQTAVQHHQGQCQPKNKVTAVPAGTSMYISIAYPASLQSSELCSEQVQAVAYSGGPPQHWGKTVRRVGTLVTTTLSFATQPAAVPAMCTVCLFHTVQLAPAADNTITNECR